MSPSVEASLSARDRRALLTGALVLLPALAYVGGVRPLVRTLQERRATLAAQRELLIRERALVASAATLRGALRQATEAAMGTQPLLFRAVDGLAATAALASWVGELAEEEGVTVEQVETREPAPRPDGLVEVTLELRAHGDLEAVLALLRAIESGERVVRISRLGLARTPDEARDSTAIEDLALTATMQGYVVPNPGARRAWSEAVGALDSARDAASHRRVEGESGAIGANTATPLPEGAP